MTLILTAESGTQTLQVANVSEQFPINVTNAATTVDILQVRGTAGSLKKLGPGDLRVRNIAEAGNLVLELEQGNVQVDGSKRVQAAPTEVLEKSLVWLDASQTNTWRTHSYVDEDGRTRVTNWVDAAGREAAAEIWDNSSDKIDSHLARANFQCNTHRFRDSA